MGRNDSNLIYRNAFRFFGVTLLLTKLLFSFGIATNSFDIENELMKQKIKLYLCEKCPETIFKTYDHYKRHIEYNCKLIK